MVVQLPAHHTEGVVLGVVVNVDLGEARAGARRDPPLRVVVVDHHGGAGAAYRLLAVNNDRGNFL